MRLAEFAAQVMLLVRRDSLTATLSDYLTVPGLWLATGPIGKPGWTGEERMNRRTFLKGAGAVTVVAAGGGVWRAADQGVFRAAEGPAYEPWRTWDADAADGPLALVRAAILASNPHNTQPWLFRVTESRIDLYADRARNLGAFDPFLREMHLGLGCALENLVLAAAANGYEPTVTLVEGTLSQRTGSATEPTPVACVELTPGPGERSGLHEAIPQRHTNRGPYDADRPLPPAALAALRHVEDVDPNLIVHLFTAEVDRARFADLVVRATEAIIADEEMVHASERWFRHSWDRVQELRDGVTLDAAGLPPLQTAIAKMLPRPSAETNHEYWLDSTRDVHVATAPVFGLIAVHDLYDKQQALRAGRLWQRKHLWATTQGIAMHPLNQPVELVDRERELGRESQAARLLEAFVGDPAWKATFAFRAGYPVRDAHPSPRRAVGDVVRAGG